MKLLALTAVAGSFGILAVAAWDAALTKSQATHRAELNEASVPSTQPQIATTNRIQLASAAAESGWALRTQEFQALLFSGQPMISPPPANAGEQASAQDEPIPVPRGAPVKAATEREPKPQVRQAPDKDALIMTPARIGQIKERLRLTPEQEAHWPTVETALREIGRQQVEAQKRGEKIPKAVLSPEFTQQLYWSAGPLIMSLREDQKREARSLALSMGLERVASLL